MNYFQTLYLAEKLYILAEGEWRCIIIRAENWDQFFGGRRSEVGGLEILTISGDRLEQKGTFCGDQCGVL